MKRRLAFASAFLFACGKAGTLPDASVTERDAGSIGRDAIAPEEDAAQAMRDAAMLQPGEVRIEAARGGVVASEDGIFTLTIPPGAIAADTTFAIRVVAPAAELVPLEPVTAVYEIEPDGTRFDPPAIARWKFEVAPPLTRTGTAPRMLLGVSRSSTGAVTPHEETTAAYDGPALVALSKVRHLSETALIRSWEGEYLGELFTLWGSATREVGEVWGPAGRYYVRSTEQPRIAVGWATDPQQPGYQNIEILSGTSNRWWVRDPTVITSTVETHSGAYRDRLGDPTVGVITPPQDPQLTCTGPVERALQVVELSTSRARVQTLEPVRCAPPKPRPQVVYGETDLCTLLPGGHVRCDGQPKAFCDVRIPDESGDATRVGGSILETLEAPPRPGAPAGFDIEGGRNGCTATKGPNGYETAVRSVDRAFGGANVTVNGVQAPVAGALERNGADAPIGDAQGEATVIKLHNNPGDSAVYRYEVRASGAAGTATGIVEQIVDLEDLPLELGVRVTQAVPPDVSRLLREQGLEIVRGQVCDGRVTEDATILGDALQIITARCIQFEPPHIMCNAEEHCDQLDDDCDGIVDEGCPVRLEPVNALPYSSGVRGTPVPGGAAASPVCGLQFLVGVAGGESGPLYTVGSICGNFWLTYTSTETRPGEPIRYRLYVEVQRLLGPVGNDLHTQTPFRLECPPGTFVGRIAGEADTELGQIEVECVEWELVRRPGNVWGVQERVRQVLGRAGSGSGVPFTWTPPTGMLGVPPPIRGIVSQYSIGGPLNSIELQSGEIRLVVLPGL
ncbi:MAG: hypothetical protein U1E65_04925 [Myxococcota bacterium]